MNKLCDSLRQVLCNDVTIEKNADSFQLLITDINSTDISIDLEISFRTIVSEIFVDKHTKKENTDVRSNILFYQSSFSNSYLLCGHRPCFSNF